MAGVEQLVDMPHGIQRTAVCSIGVLFRRQVGLEDRFEYKTVAVCATRSLIAGTPNGLCFLSGLGYASHVVVKSDSGTSIPVMHACGHDIHMSSWMGTAKLMAANRDRWHGTLIFIGQPAEETGEGAPAMIKDGLFTRFLKPDYALAIHDSAILPVGQVGFTPGYALAAADSVDISIYGRG